jgi:midasin
MFLQPSEDRDASDEVPSNNEKGIEMEQDFAADTYSISGDSAEDNNEDSEDVQLDSAMGETEANGEVVDEKLWNKDEDENPGDTNEKYESGSSVRDRDGSRELRAKEDYAAAAGEPGELNSDEPGELDSDEIDKQDDEIGSEDNLGDRDNTEDMKLEKDEAFADPTGLKLDELNQSPDEDMEMDEPKGADSVEEADPSENKESDEKGKQEEESTYPTDETIGEAETEQMDGDPEKDPGGDHEENVEMSLTEPSNNAFKPGSSDFVTDHVPNAQSATQPKGDSQTSDIRNIAPESNWSSGNDAQNDLAPLRGLPSNNTTEVDFSVADLSNSGRFTDDQSKSQLPQHESSSTQKTQPNPYRNVGDALEEWKERVKVSVDLQADNTEALGEIEDENADEYGYVSEFEKGTAQALGPATSEQVDGNVSGNKPDGDSLSAHKNDLADMEIEKQNSEAPPLRSYASIHKNKIEELMHISDLEKLPNEGSEEVRSHDDGNPESLSESLVSVKKSFLSEGIHQFSKLSVAEDEFGKAQDPGEVSNDVKNIATVLWRRYELLTTRFSQELAEQLRLVMEPTLASKLQGDYKTGKRINMKKVIPYIASHYRKDKIWLRRTRPNKRDYQVVIAVDDSRSMSESRCGDAAIEALVTVCRAMSQLEVGSLAVASFGKKGNIRLLHDFDQPFSGEAGIKMISSLTFKQENTIADEPVVDLLKYLNNMLDVAVGKARLPSGQNPLQQLVLIIGDGRLHEKENLKRCVRDALSRKRMVAFLVLDTSSKTEESIMNLDEISFEGTNMKKSKYMDSFPFPYYIVLKKIEALPRTLSDLLRQWFEVMQYWRD